MNFVHAGGYAINQVKAIGFETDGYFNDGITSYLAISVDSVDFA